MRREGRQLVIFRNDSLILRHQPDCQMADREWGDVPMRKLVIFAGLLWCTTPACALACWSCHGLSQEECDRRIEESRVATAAEMAKAHAQECDGRPDGKAPFGFGISTAGSFSIYCSREHGNWMHWNTDDTGKVRDQYYRLGGASSHLPPPPEVREGLQLKHNPNAQGLLPELAESRDPGDYETESVDEHGYRVIYFAPRPKNPLPRREPLLELANAPAPGDH